MDSFKQMPKDEILAEAYIFKKALTSFLSVVVWQVEEKEKNIKGVYVRNLERAINQVDKIIKHIHNQ